LDGLYQGREFLGSGNRRGAVKNANHLSEGNGGKRGTQVEGYKKNLGFDREVAKNNFRAEEGDVKKQEETGERGNLLPRKGVPKRRFPLGRGLGEELYKTVESGKGK